MKTLKLAILAGALTSIAAIAVAQDATTPAPRMPEAKQATPEQPRRMGRFARLDANKDGAIDSREFATAQNLTDADTNGDGTLSKEELVAMIQKRQAERQAERMTRRLDVDGDGIVTIAEIEKQRGERFAVMDRNDDGKLEGRELRRGGRDGGHRKFDRHGGRGDHRGGERFMLDL